MNLKQITQIFEGWRNDLLPPDNLKELIKKVGEERLAICRNCKAFDEKGEGCAIPGSHPCCHNKIIVEGNIKGCGCPLKKKVKCLSCECPAKKWLAVTTFEKEQEISKKLKENGK